ncbi:hypothetical protein Ddc_03922 [Ditylenchus destructor]|nr:hypothetical protein Ddc_03922 [Ditylenchus destructor]
MATTFTSIAAKLAALPIGLERLIEDDPEQLQYWYEQLVELELPDTEDGFTREDIEIISQATRLIMQYEHTNAEELKEVAEREAVEMAEKEENWEMERDMLKEEISNLRERITSRAGISETNEAFRAEIDSLTSENAYLKQLGRERDRELADQRDKVEELSSRVESLEKEKALFISNQAQLEDTIREMNRRISSKSDISQRTDWESRKLRQRNEQAILLSDQLQNVISQNDELKAEVERLTEALENATVLIQDSSSKYAEFSEQLGQAETSIERLAEDNKELRQQLAEKDSKLTESVDEAKMSDDEMRKMLLIKNAQIEQLRDTLQRNELEIEELRARLELQHNPEREEELERLRTELVSATQTARKLFGAAMLEADSAAQQTADPMAELRLRIVQMDKEVELAENRIKSLEKDKIELEAALEQKDLENARVIEQNQRYRQLAFGDADGEVRRLEKQLEFRDNQIEKLNHKCTLLQVELQQHLERDTEAKEPKRVRIKDQESPEVTKKKPKAKSKELETEEIAEEATEVIPETKEISQEPTIVGPPSYFMKPQTREEVEANAAVIKSLYEEIVRLIHEVESKQKELDNRAKLQAERDGLLTAAKKETAQVQKLLDELRDSIFGKSGGEQILDENELAAKNEALEIENMELRRFADSIKNTTGNEKERRMAEGTRRLVFLAIQNQRLERRAETNQSLRKAIAEENSRLAERCQRLAVGDQRRSRQLTMENEINLIEIARLQNALLHSAPLAEYNRLLRDYKQLLHRSTIGSAGSSASGTTGSDAGYQSAEDDSSSISQAYQFNINRSAILLSENRKTEEMLVRNQRLEEMSQILEAQNDYLKRECEKSRAEVEELSAFLNDLEEETELKSMIVNIERRFVQALREQFDSTQDRMISEHQLSNLEKELHRRRREWQQERQHLVNVISNLHTVLRKIHSDKPIPISIEQLIALKKTMEYVREKEQIVARKLTELDRSKRETQEKTELVSELNEQLKAVNFVNVDFSQLMEMMQRLEAAEIAREEDKPEAAIEQRTEIALSQTTTTLTSPSPKPGITIARRRESMPHEKDVLIFDNSKEYEAEIKSVKQAAKLCVQNYQEQLEQKDRAIQEYRSIIETLRLSTVESQQSRQTLKEPREAQEKLEEKERHILVLERQVRELEDANARLAEQLMEEQNAHMQQISGRRNVGIQANLPVSTSAAQKPPPASQISTEIQIHEEEPGKSNIDEKEHAYEVPDDFEQDSNEEEDEEGAEANEDEEDTDSGTVEDIVEERRPKRVRSVSRSDSGGSEGRRSSGATQTIHRAATSAGISGAQETGRSSTLDPETLLLRHRNETRRLRMRLMALERRNKQLLDENTSLKERSRHIVNRKPIDPNSEAGLFKKDNERLMRENKNLAKSLQEQKNELDGLHKRLRRQETAGKTSTEMWEERKRQQQTINTLKSRIADLEKRERDLNERLIRRDKHIEQMSKEQTSRYTDTDQLNTVIKEWRQEKATFEKKEKQLTDEVTVWTERQKNSNSRLEMLAKENKSLHIKISALQEKAACAKTKRVETINREAQTPDEFNFSYQELEREKEKVRILTQKQQISRRSFSRESGMPTISRVPSHSEWVMPGHSEDNFQFRKDISVPATSRASIPGQVITARSSADNADMRREQEENKSLTKHLRRAELLQIETTEQLNAMKTAYDELLSNYNSLLRKQINLTKRQELRRYDEEGVAALTVLKDKLAAKDNEIDRQRHKIVELERRLWVREMGRSAI